MVMELIILILGLSMFVIWTYYWIHTHLDIHLLSNQDDDDNDSYEGELL